MNNKKQINKIAIVGAGGIGGFVTSFLFDYSVVRNQYPDYARVTIDLFDDDAVDLKNTLHQIYTLDDVGKSKVELLAERYLVNACPRFMTPEDFGNYDVILCCVDDIVFRQKLYEYGYSNPKLFWIDGRCNSRNIGLMHSKMSREELEPLTQAKDTTRKGCLRQIDKEENIAHATPRIIAGMMVQTFFNYLRNDPLGSSPILLFI